MEIVSKKIDILLPKKKKERKVELLRDPLDKNLFPLFFNNAGSYYKRQKDLKRSQLRVTYIILYHCGLRINEIRYLTRSDIEKAIDAAQFNIVHYKRKPADIHVLSKKAILDLRNCKTELKIIFEKYQYKYLFGKDLPITNVSLIRLGNKDLKVTCEKFGIPFNIKSHSFRINMITNLLKVTSVQRAANVIGHSDIRATMNYNRYALSKKEIQDLLDQINLNES